MTTFTIPIILLIIITKIIFVLVALLPLQLLLLRWCVKPQAATRQRRDLAWRVTAAVYALK